VTDAVTRAEISRPTTPVGSAAPARLRVRRAAVSSLGAALRLIAAVEDPAIARRILECIGLPARAPPIAPAVSSDTSLRSSEPDKSWDYDQTPSAPRSV